MSIVIFVLGRPGSGKSSAARRIEKLVRKSCEVVRINDYDILQELSKVHSSKFRKVAYGGFDVIDFSILDVALKKEECTAKSQSVKKDITIIEFARSDYEQALSQFSKSFLQDAYFLFLDTNVETCIRRVHCRVKNQASPDDYFVSSGIIRGYYANQIFSTQSAKMSFIDKERIMILNNNGSRDKFDVAVTKFVNLIFEQHPYLIYESRVRKIIFKLFQTKHLGVTGTFFARAMSIIKG